MYTVGRVLALCFVLFMPTASVHASPLTIYGFWPRDISMGGAATATSPGPGTAFLNPAGAAFSEEQIVGLGFSAFSPQLYVDRALPYCDPQQNTCIETYPKGFSETPSLLPDHALGISLGWIKPLGGFFKRRLALSAGLYLPTKNILKAEGVDSVIPHFVMVQSLTDKIVIASAISWRPLDWISVGVGMQALADLGSDISLDIDVLGHRFVKQDLSVSVSPKVGATAGLMIRPFKHASIGATYRQALPLVFRIPADFSLGKVIEADIYFEGIVLYSPDQLEIGGAYFIDAFDLEVTFQANLSYWSSMRDLSPRIDVNFGGDVIDGFGAGELLDLRETEARPLVGFRDNWTFHGGLEWQAHPRVQIRAGGQYRPSPAPPMTGNKNLLDNDAWGLSGGVGIVIGDLWGIHRAPVHLDIGLMSLFLVQRTILKGEGDPVGDLNHGGFILGGGVSLSHRY